MNFSHGSFTLFMGRQIALARKEQGLNQGELSGKLGFKDRQTLSNIEKGLRKVSSHELVSLMEILNRPMDYFTDPYQLPKKQLFAWRVKSDNLDDVAYEEKGRLLLSTYMRFSDLLNEKASPILPQLSINKDSTYDEITELGEYLADFWDMGTTPASKLEEVINKYLQIQLFYIEPPDEVSGASFHSDWLSAILINRKHSIGRQHFSIAHELFHILTWNIFHPTHIASAELVNEIKDRSEKLANCFAAGLLMPSQYILTLWDQRNNLDLKVWLEETAEFLEVSPDALFWRLVTLRKLKKSDRPENWDLAFTCDHQPKLYSRQFVDMIYKVLADGKVSIRKTLTLLDCKLEDLEALLLSYSLPVPFEL